MPQYPTNSFTAKLIPPFLFSRKTCNLHLGSLTMEAARAGEIPSYLTVRSLGFPTLVSRGAQTSVSGLTNAQSPRVCARTSSLSASGADSEIHQPVVGGCRRSGAGQGRVWGRHLYCCLRDTISCLCKFHEWHEGRSHLKVTHTITNTTHTIPTCISYTRIPEMYVYTQITQCTSHIIHTSAIPFY